MPRHFRGRLFSFNAKTFSGTIVQFIHHLVDFRLSDGCKVPMLWEVLANESIGVLIQATFPGGIGMGKEEPGTEAFSDGLVTGE
ncbi:hypothetical protein BOW12_05295, partial [Solemya velum gill symbiont]